MARNCRSFALASAVLALWGCHRSITPSSPQAFQRCVDKPRSGYTTVRGKAKLAWTDAGRTLRLQTSFLAAKPDSFYLEGDGFGLPALVAAHQGKTFTLYAPAKNEAFIDRRSPTLRDLFGIPVTWATWTSILLSSFDGATWTAFHPDCAPKTGMLPTGERIELGSSRGPAPTWVRLSWPEGSVRWDYRSYEADLAVPPAWFSVDLSPSTQLLDHPFSFR